jgi:hypothetical protein
MFHAPQHHHQQQQGAQGFGCQVQQPKQPLARRCLPQEASPPGWLCQAKSTKQQLATMRAQAATEALLPFFLRAAWVWVVCGFQQVLMRNGRSSELATMDAAHTRHTSPSAKQGQGTALGPQKLQGTSARQHRALSLQGWVSSHMCQILLHAAALHHAPLLTPVHPNKPPALHLVLTGLAAALVCSTSNGATPSQTTQPKRATAAAATACQKAAAASSAATPWQAVQPEHPAATTACQKAAAASTHTRTLSHQQHHRTTRCSRDLTNDGNEGVLCVLTHSGSQREHSTGPVG